MNMKLDLSAVVTELISKNEHSKVLFNLISADIILACFLEIKLSKNTYTVAYYNFGKMNKKWLLGLE